MEQILVFTIDDKKYAVPIESVVEIVVLHAITKLPDMPHCIAGMINLRGKLVPVMDIRDRLYNIDTILNDRKCMVIVENNNDEVAFIVDEVKEVVALTDAIEVSDTTSAEDKYIKAIVTYGDETYLVLNIPEILDLQFAI